MKSIPDILLSISLLAPGDRIELEFQTNRERSAFKRRFAAYRAAIKAKSYRIAPDDPAFGVSAYDSVLTKDIGETTLWLIQSPQLEDMGVTKVTICRQEDKKME